MKIRIQIKAGLLLFLALYLSLTRCQAQDSLQVLESDIGDSCVENEDCSLTTHCCSEGKCVPGRVCLLGLKSLNDTCNYYFECYSRCCFNNQTCLHFRHCVQQCESNSDCNTGCCSLNVCSADSTCLTGRKIDGDYCDLNSECANNLCSYHRCTKSEA